MYGGDGPTLAQPAPDESKKPEGEEKEGGQTFLLNKDISPDFQVGEEMVVKIVAVHDKEYEVEYAEAPGKETGADEKGMAPEGAPGAGGSGGAPDSMYG